MTDPATAALGRLPSGLYILTLGDGDTGTGMLASWVQQAAFSPPMVSVAVQAGRPIGDRIEGGEPFALSVVGEGQKGLLKHFARGFAPDEPAFEGLELLTTPSGVATLAESVAWLECVASDALAAGDHRVVIARVTHSEILREHPPAVHLRKRGDHY